MEKKMNVPGLRFPEFVEEWVEKKLGEIAEIVGGGTPDTLNKILWNGNIEWFTPTELKTKYVSNSIRKISTEGLKQSSAKILPVGTVLFSSRATVGDISIALKECATNQGFQSFIVNKDYNNELIYYWLCNNKNEFVKRASGSTFLEISKNEIIKIDIIIPSLPEQTKIASFLTAADDKLTQLKKKKSLLEEYKKGVMQKIFSQELRFKNDNGEDFPEWEEKKIKDVFKFKQGVQCGTENQYLEKENNMQRFIRIIDLTSTNEPIRYINSPGIEHHITLDDLFMVRYGTPGLVGYGYEGIIANNLFRIIPIKNVINRFYYFVFNFLNKELTNLASSSTMPALNFGSLEALSIPEPSLPEQTKIANFLSAIDEKINHCSTQIERMEEWKKGLLQQMFV